MKKLKSIIIIALYLVVSGVNTFSQSIKNNEYNAQSKSIIVPDVKVRPVVIDGVFSTGEWDDAIHFPISEKVEIYFMANSGNLYVGLKFIGEFLGEAVSEIYIALNNKEFYNLHSSGASGEGINSFSDDFKSTKFTVGNNKDWESNPGKRGEVACYGKEYRISLNKFGSTSLKFAGGIIFVNNSMRVNAHFPQKYDFKNSDKWVELILPSAFPGITGPYLGQKPPGDTAKPFATAFFGSMFRSFHSGIVFSPDGNAAYWQAMLNDESKGQAIFESRIEKGFWTNPRVAPFSELVKGGRDDSPFISPDGERLLFLSERPVEKGGKPGVERIWVTKRMGKGWSEPELVPLSWNPADGRIHWRLSVDGKGNLYFGAWKIRGEEVTGEIFQTRFEDGQYRASERLGPEINREGYYNFCPSIAPDGSYLIFTSVGPKANDRLPDNIYCSFRDKDGKWTQAQKLQIPGDKGNDVPTISSDGKYLFMRHGLNRFYWVETSLIEKLRPKE